MNKSLIKKVFFVVFLILSLIFVNFDTSASNIDSYGVTPSNLNLLYLRKGSFVSNEFVVSRTNVLESEQFSIEIDAPLFRNWISIEPENVLTLNKDEKEKKFFMHISVPKDAKEQTYEGSISIKVLKTSLNGNRITVLPALNIKLNLQVGENIVRNLKVLAIQFVETKSNQPIKVKVKIRNEGNIDDSLDSLVLNLTKQSKEQTKLVSTSKPFIPAFMLKEVNYEFSSTNLENGFYLGTVEAIYQNKIIFTQSISFDLTNSEVLGSSVSAEIKEKINQKIIGILFIFTGFLLLSLTVFFAVKFFKKRSSY